MIGLTKNQSRIYETIRHLQDVRAVAPTARDVAEYLNDKTCYIIRVLPALERRGFLTIGKLGDIFANDPPHNIVVREVLSKSSVTRDELLSKRKFANIVAVRRVIAKRLRHKFNYSYRAIADVLNMNVRSVDEYFKPEFSARRSLDRKRKYHAMKAAQSEMREAA